MKTLKQLKAELEAVEMTMPITFQQQKEKNAAMMVLSREIEKLEDPKSYEENKAHWEGYEFRPI